MRLATTSRWFGCLRQIALSLTPIWYMHSNEHSIDRGPLALALVLIS